MAAPRLSNRVANVFLRLCEEISVATQHSLGSPEKDESVVAAGWQGL